jgi:pimeloyl-ACP methyl ester carboxylesterase
VAKLVYAAISALITIGVQISLAQTSPNSAFDSGPTAAFRRVLEKTVKVPEKHAAPESSITIDLYVLVLRSPNALSHVPVFWLSGGPGDAASDEFLANGPRWAQKTIQRLSEVRDVVMVDQRGTGRTLPRLVCPERLLLPLDIPVSRHEYVQALATEVTKCKSLWEKRGVNLSAYNTLESARDLESVRVALGYDKIALVGESYGTQLALAYLKYYPSNVERAVLMGVEGLANTLRTPGSFDDLLSRLESWNRTLPMCPYCDVHLSHEMDLIRSRLSEGDVKGAYVDERGTVNTIALSDFDFDFVMFNEARRSDAVEAIPSLVLQMRANDFSWLAQRVARIRKGQVASAMHYSMVCSSGASAERLRLIESSTRLHPSGFAVNFPFPDICDAVGVHELGDDFRDRFSSPIPIMFVGGSFDVRTPIADAHEIADDFPNVTFYEEQVMGHEAPRDPFFLDRLITFFK